MRILFFILFFVLASCQSTVDKNIPNDILSMEKMKIVLFDFHLIKSQINIWNQKNTISLSQKDSIYNSLYVKHEITAKDFNNSLSYYINNNIDSLNVIYDDVIKNLIKESYKISQ